jgi:environmental stress-induced protein Ves
MQIVRYESLVATPWKNGGGVTREAIRVPPDADPFAWRVSFAQIDRSGPFSDFSGYARHMVLLRGAGVRLDFAGGRQAQLLDVGDYAQFDGAVATHGALVQGPCIDLNVIVSQASHTASASIEAVRRKLEWPAAPGQSVLIVAIEAGVVVEDERGESADLAVWDLAAGNLRCVTANPPCRVFVARIIDNRTTNR